MSRRYWDPYRVSDPGTYSLLPMLYIACASQVNTKPAENEAKEKIPFGFQAAMRTEVNGDADMG